MKVGTATALISFGFAYATLCAYGISRTGSTTGLADMATPQPWPFHIVADVAAALAHRCITT